MFLGVTKIRLSLTLQVVWGTIIDSASKFLDLWPITPSFTSIATFEFVTETPQIPFVLKVPVVRADENVVMHHLMLLNVPSNLQLVLLFTGRRSPRKKKKKKKKKKMKMKKKKKWKVCLFPFMFISKERSIAQRGWVKFFRWGPRVIRNLCPVFPVLHICLHTKFGANIHNFSSLAVFFEIALSIQNRNIWIFLVVLHNCTQQV